MLRCPAFNAFPNVHVFPIDWHNNNQRLEYQVDVSATDFFLPIFDSLYGTEKSEIHCVEVFVHSLAHDIRPAYA